jgi:hypothetical protein
MVRKLGRNGGVSIFGKIVEANDGRYCQEQAANNRQFSHRTAKEFSLFVASAT